ncbi:hypothetical protein EDB87DRAFT_1760306 [Lactarius vividus]|nr:hypothetical protein EDB87DRAFT_1760306 [Lactarius vividus]
MFSIHFSPVYAFPGSTSHNEISTQEQEGAWGSGLGFEYQQAPEVLCAIAGELQRLCASECAKERMQLRTVQVQVHVWARICVRVGVDVQAKPPQVASRAHDSSRVDVMGSSFWLDPDEELEADESTPADNIDQVITNHLVLFRSVPALQAQNQKLLGIVREMGAKIHWNLASFPLASENEERGGGASVPRGRSARDRTRRSDACDIALEIRAATAEGEVLEAREGHARRADAKEHLIDPTVGKRSAEVDDKALEPRHAPDLRDEKRRVGLGQVDDIHELERDEAPGELEQPRANWRTDVEQIEHAEQALHRCLDVDATHALAELEQEMHFLLLPYRVSGPSLVMHYQKKGRRMREHGHYGCAVPAHEVHTETSWKSEYQVPPPALENPASIGTIYRTS